MPHAIRFLRASAGFEALILRTDAEEALYPPCISSHSGAEVRDREDLITSGLLTGATSRKDTRGKACFLATEPSSVSYALDAGRKALGRHYFMDRVPELPYRSRPRCTKHMPKIKVRKLCP